MADGVYVCEYCMRLYSSSFSICYYTQFYRIAMRCIFNKTLDLFITSMAFSFSLIGPYKKGFPRSAGASQISKGAAFLTSGATVPHCVATLPLEDSWPAKQKDLSVVSVWNCNALQYPVQGRWERQILPCFEKIKKEQRGVMHKKVASTNGCLWSMSGKSDQGCSFLSFVIYLSWKERENKQIRNSSVTGTTGWHEECHGSGHTKVQKFAWGRY